MRRIVFIILILVGFIIPSLSFAQSTGPVKVVGRQLLVDFDQNGAYEPYFIKGIGYAPYPVGVFPSQWGLCEYCNPSSACQYNAHGDNFACSAETGGGPQHPWGGQTLGGNQPYPNLGMNLFDRTDVYLDRDFQNLVDLHVNTIRTWEKVTPTLLAKAHQYGIKVIAGYWIGNLYTDQGQLVDRQPIKNDFQSYVHQAKLDSNFSSILFFAIGNENNFYYYTPGQQPPGAPLCYQAPGLDPLDTRMAIWFGLAQDLAFIGHTELGTSQDRPMAVVNGDIDEIGNFDFFSRDEDMPSVDIWGANTYRGNSFGNLFSTFVGKSDKPLWISECGVDALFTDDFYTNKPGLPSGYYDPLNVTNVEAIQASWLAQQWDEVLNNSAVTIGSTFFEYSDEYWKGNVNPASYHWDAYVREHNNTGACPTYPPDPSSPALPDGFFNEEWFGIMAVTDASPYDVMTKRPAFDTLQRRFTCPANSPYYAGLDNNKSCDGTSTCCPNAFSKSKANSCVSSCDVTPGTPGGGRGKCYSLNCFTADTAILMVDDTQKPIEEVKVGDMVKSVDREGHMVTDKVTQVFIHPETAEYLAVQTADGKELHVTKEHPVLSNGEYKEIGTLTVDSPLSMLKDGKLVETKIISMKKVNNAQTVYNLEVENSHTYFADGYLVHNKACPPMPNYQNAQ